MKPEIKCPKCGSLGEFMWIGQACGNILTETGELMYYYVQGEMPEDDDKLVCQNWEDECEHEGTVAEFKAAAEASE